jgi:hypothetical protein
VRSRCCLGRVDLHAALSGAGTDDPEIHTDLPEIHTDLLLQAAERAEGASSERLVVAGGIQYGTDERSGADGAAQVNPDDLPRWGIAAVVEGEFLGELADECGLAGAARSEQREMCGGLQRVGGTAVNRLEGRPRWDR